MVSPSYLIHDRSLLMLLGSSEMTSYGFVFPTKSFSLLPKGKIRYLNFSLYLPVRLESVDIYFSELWLSLKHQSCSIKRMFYCLWLLPTAVYSYLKAIQLRCVEQQCLSGSVCACPYELQLASSTMSLAVFSIPDRCWATKMAFLESSWLVHPYRLCSKQVDWGWPNRNFSVWF